MSTFTPARSMSARTLDERQLHLVEDGQEALGLQPVAHRRGQAQDGVGGLRGGRAVGSQRGASSAAMPSAAEPGRSPRNSRARSSSA